MNVDLLHNFLMTSCIIFQNYFLILVVTWFKYIDLEKTRVAGSNSAYDMHVNHITLRYTRVGKGRYAVIFWFVTTVKSKQIIQKQAMKITDSSQLFIINMQKKLTV
jgi:hypothetical protein